MRIACIVICGLLLAACSQTTGSMNPEPGSPGAGAMQRGSGASTYQYLYGFKGHPSDGKWPDGSLVAVNGTIYGVTMTAGPNEHGAVFSIDSSGNERIVYAFTGYPDGLQPNGLTFLNGTFYGTTFGGGAHRNGTVFTLTPSGAERTIHSFGGLQDGREPTGVVSMDGRLYGLTQLGGANDRGAVFEISTSGSERVIYSFKDGSDGAVPVGRLLAKDHVLYGTTFQGGGTGCYRVGCGTFFSITPAGTKTILYDFKGQPDGAYPEDVIFSHGEFYGVTPFGGTRGGGTLYAVSASGHERVVHSFNGNVDGYDPTGIVSVGSKLYGTAGFGPGRFVGTLFELDASGTFSVIHEFAEGRHEGGVPNGAFALTNGVLYGTTAHGGLDNNGTVFTLTP
jgi:uncharacterized repeat protein (TIGR03803 family)